MGEDNEKWGFVAHYTYRDLLLLLAGDDDDGS